MEVNLRLVSTNEDWILNLRKENEEEIKEKKIIEYVKEKIKEYNTYSPNSLKPNYSIHLEKVNDRVYNIKLKNTDKLKDEISIKIESCSEKEKILNEKKEEFQKLQNDLKIDEKLLEKKLISLLGGHKPEYDEIINQIIDLMLDYDSFNKEASILQEKIIKYRSSNILQLCFKIYWQRLHTCMQYMVKKYILFLYNEKLFKTTSKILPTLIKILIDDIYDRILNGISKNNIFLKHKGNYQKKIQFYREFCYMFFIFQSFDKDSEKEIFNIKEDIDLDDSENLFDDVERFKYHILNRTGLNISLEFFKERVNIDDVYESYFKKILLLYQKYKSFLPYYKRCGFLYG